MNTLSISLGRFFGIKTTIHWTFWILIIWIIFSNYSKGQSSTQILWYLLFVFAIFFCVVLHELGHALAARRYGIQTQSITILPIGGVASLEKIPSDPLQELIVAIAGPMVNIIIAGILFLFFSVTGNWSITEEALINITPSNFLIALFSVNLMLVIFNLIPAFPMDGGRVLRALLAFRMDRLKATQWAVSIGQLFAVLFVFWGFSNNPFLIFIALFIFISANSELEHVRSEKLLGGHLVKDIIMHDFTIFNASDPVSRVVQVLLDSQESSFLVEESNALVGSIEKHDLIKGLVEKGDHASVAEIMQKELIWLNPDMPLLEAREIMMRTGTSILPVGNGYQLEGVLNLENVNEFLLVQSALNQRKG